MRNWLAACTVAAGTWLWATPALPCGGGFGAGLTIGQDQKIFIAHKAGIETYFFAPHFCGKAAHFGLILPVPSTLTADPQLGDTSLVTELEAVTAPAVQTRKECRSGDGVGAAPGGYRGGTGGTDQGVNVVDKGQVGIFEWSLLQADTVAAFTDWLDANQYPYEPAATSTFQHYVDSKWLFVAFKVAADTNDPPSSMLLCGDLGPIQLSFASAAPVVPARIAAATNPNSGYTWRFFVVSAAQQQPAAGVSSQLQYSGVLTAADLSSHPALGKLAHEGEWLTKLDVTFVPGELTSDIAFEASSTPAPYRAVIWNTEYEDCESGGLFECASNAGGARNTATGVVMGLALAALCRRRRAKASAR
jgi:hypothetical protein